MRSIRKLIAGAAGALLAAVAAPSYANDLQAFSELSTGTDTGAWQLVTLRNRPSAQFEIVADGDGRALQVTADGAAGALAHPVAASSAASTELRWRWKIANHIAASDISTKQGDDFPARVYVTFARDARELPLGTRIKMRLAKLLYGQEIPTSALCYIWARDLPMGTVVANAYTDNVMMVVVRSGGETPSVWQAEQRDIAADYRAAFGAAAPAVSSVIIAADTDNTGERVRSWFGDLSLVALPFAHGEENLQRPLEAAAVN